MDHVFDQQFFTMAIRLIVTVLLCGIIGIEREFQDKPAGLRTHIIVGVGSCTMMLFTIYGFVQFQDNLYQIDLTRIPSYIISGIGFLGAGAIMRRDSKVSGLTTGASIWTTAGLGLVVGVGMYDLAVLATIIIVVSLYFLRAIEKKI